MADQSALLCGTPFIWRTPRGASSVPTSDSRYENSECVTEAWGQKNKWSANLADGAANALAQNPPLTNKKSIFTDIRFYNNQIMNVRE